jgi:hypothetical protein
MDKSARREAVRDYKERKDIPGIFKITCAASAEVWVGSSRNLPTQQNGIWFQLKLGSARSKTMQAAWKAFGAEAFAFLVVEELENEDVEPYVLQQRLKDRLAHWREALGARPVID